MKNEEFLCNLTALFLRYYIMEPTKEHFEELFSCFSDQLVMIGTGKHEFFTSIEQILDNLKDNLVEAETISFQVLDEWYECRMVSQDVYLVYGGIWVRQQEQGENDTLIDMDTRFSVIYRKQNESYEIVHIHHSIPYVDQQYGEYYPKTLIAKAEEAMIRAKMFEEKSELDLMTEIYNNISFKHHVTEQMNACDRANMYLFDLDYFKTVNDTHGHAKGDELLTVFASLLKRSFDQDAIIGRMGGDEFAVFEKNPLDKAYAIKKITDMQSEFKTAVQKILCEGTASFSVGIVSGIKHQYVYSAMFIKADQALYRAKQIGRQTHYWYDE